MRLFFKFLTIICMYIFYSVINIESNCRIVASLYNVNFSKSHILESRFFVSNISLVLFSLSFHHPFIASHCRGLLFFLLRRHRYDSFCRPAVRRYPALLPLLFLPLSFPFIPTAFSSLHPTVPPTAFLRTGRKSARDFYFRM